jgi:predicted Zn-dependent protease
MLNDTSDGERHIVVTQNGLADGMYLDYINELYADRMVTLTLQDSRRIFEEYVADAQKRLQHDEQFPDEPKQVRPGENITMEEGQVKVSGQVAVMAINEKILQALIEKNPDLSFAVQESFPMKATYADALPLGPLMELRAQNEETSFTAERAAQSVDYWNTTAQGVLTDPEAAGSATTLKSYSHDANATANLLAAHNYIAEAEQAYHLSSQLWPGNPEPVGGLAAILASAGRSDEARQMLDDFARNHPDQRSAIETFRGSILWTATAPPVEPSP